MKEHIVVFCKLRKMFDLSISTWALHFFSPTPSYIQVSVLNTGFQIFRLGIGCSKCGGVTPLGSCDQYKSLSFLLVWTFFL